MRVVRRKGEEREIRVWRKGGEVVWGSWMGE